MQQPLVTVYIATHNRPEMLRRALRSVYAQTYPHLEIIVVDDGSAPSAEKGLVNDIAEKKIRFIRNETPEGACSARNKAIAAATGSYITGLDDDDAFTPGRIENLINAFRHSPRSLSCVASCITEQTSAGAITRQFDSGVVTIDMLRHYNFLGNQVLTRTEFLQKIGGFDESLPAFQDYDTWLRLVKQFGPALKISDPSYIWYTAHEAQRISGSSEKRQRAFQAFMSKHSEDMNQQQLNSMELIRKKVYGQPIGYRDAIKLMNRYNRRSVIAQLVNHRAKGLKRLINALRLR
ncbi:glycosyltransferase [Idiomarina seosinensis]|uniref:glycosyltransferase n=1 Tax=Idiomarina seosinensis TaxID=281739 RepID=UPI0038503A89